MRLRVTDMRTITDASPDVRNMEFRNSSVTIGSHSSNLLQLPDIEIASHHATLEPAGDGWVYRPTMRDEQTKLNGEPVTGQVDISNGDVIRITHFKIMVTIEDVAELVLPKARKTDELAMIRKYPVPPRTSVKKPDSDVSLTPARRKILADFVLKVGGSTDITSLLERTVRALGPGLDARMVWMGVRKKTSGPLEFVDGRLDGAPTMGEPPKLETYVYRCLTRHQFINIPRTGDGETQSVLAVPILVEFGALGLIYVDTKRRTRVFDDADLDFLTVIAASISPLLESALRATAGADEIGVSAGDWSLVREIQGKLKPRDSKRWPSLQIAHRTIGGALKSGDLYDVIRMPNGLAAVMVGHVAAEPARAAAAISEVRGAFRIAGLHADPPRVQLKALNWLLSDENDPCLLDTAIAVVNPKSGAVEIATAGRIGAILIDSRGSARKLGNRKSPPVGTGENVDYSGNTFRIKNGETLALFTSGCCRACNEADESLGEARFIEMLCDGSSQPAAAALDELLADLTPLLKGTNANDDITVLLGHRPA